MADYKMWDYTTGWLCTWSTGNLIVRLLLALHMHDNWPVLSVSV